MSEPHKITSPPGPPVARVVDGPMNVRDDDGVVHVERQYVRPVLGRDNNVIEEDIYATDCDVEVCSSWVGVTDPPTCLACLGNEC